MTRFILKHTDSIRLAVHHSSYEINQTIMNSSNLPKDVNIPVPGVINSSTNENDIQTVESGRTVNMAGTSSEHFNVNPSPEKAKYD